MFDKLSCYFCALHTFGLLFQTAFVLQLIRTKFGKITNFKKEVKIIVIYHSHDCYPFLIQQRSPCRMKV